MWKESLPSFKLTNLTDISIDGDTAVAFTENVEQRFLAYGWQVLHVNDGDTLVHYTTLVSDVLVTKFTETFLGFITQSQKPAERRTSLPLSA